MLCRAIALLACVGIATCTLNAHADAPGAEYSAGVLVAYGRGAKFQSTNPYALGAGVRVSAGYRGPGGMAYAAVVAMQHTGTFDVANRVRWLSLELGYEAPRFANLGLRIFGSGGPVDYLTYGGGSHRLFYFLGGGAAVTYYFERFALGAGVQYMFMPVQGPDEDSPPHGEVGFVEVDYRF